MFRIGFAIGAVYLAGAVYLLITSVSRWMFDEPVEDHEGLGRGALLFARIICSLLWPLMLLSGGGRRIINHIMKGE